MSPLAIPLLDRNPRYRLLLSVLHACGGYALLQQLHQLWGRSWSSNYRALLRLQRYRAIRFSRLHRHLYCYLTPAGSRFVSDNPVRRRAIPTHRQLITSCFLLEWYLRYQRLLQPPHLALCQPHNPDSATNLLSTQATLDSLTTSWQLQQRRLADLQTQIDSLQRGLKIGRASLLARLTSERQQAENAIEALRIQYSHALAALDRERFSATRSLAHSPNLRRTLIHRSCWLDSSADSSTDHSISFVLLDFRCALPSLRNTMQLLAATADRSGRPWSLTILCQDTSRQKILQRYIQQILSRSHPQSTRVFPHPMSVHVHSLDINRYLKPVHGAYPAFSVIWSNPLPDSLPHQK